MKILITGMAGFIGFHLSKKLADDGNEVIGIDNLSNYYDVKYKLLRLNELGIDCNNSKSITFKSKVYKNLTFLKIDITNKDLLENSFKLYNPDVVIHLAAQAGVRYSITNPDEYLNNNIIGFYNVINATILVGVNIFFYASSSSVYGDSSILPFKESENVDKPVSLYAASKKTNELIAHTFSNLHKIKTVGLRFFTVYGPYGRPDMAYFDFTTSILNRKKIKVFNNGNLSRDFTYIDDIVESIDLLLKNYTNDKENENLLYEIYNIGNSNPIKLLDFIRSIEKCLGEEAILDYVEMQKGDVHNTFSDSSKLFSKIGFTPKVKIDKGILEFTKWYKTVHK
jgi:UDP-glucuronate 4-epimerase